MTAPLTRPPEPIPHASREAIEARIAVLRAELEADTDRRRKAELHVEIGSLLETGLGSDAAAVREYLTAFNTEPSFRTPLFALIRIFERRRSLTNLAKLHQAEAKYASDDDERASALVDQAVLKADGTSEHDEALLLFEEAHATGPGSLDAALMLERAARSARRPDTIDEAVEARARASRDPRLAGLLLVEAAQAKESRGDLEGCYERLLEAARTVECRHRAYAAMERIARKHGDVGRNVEALSGLAEAALAYAEGAAEAHEEAGVGSPVYAEATEAREAAAGYLFESAILRLEKLDDAQGATEDLERAVSRVGVRGPTSVAMLLAASLAGDAEKASAAERALLDASESTPFVAAIHARIADRARHEGDDATENASIEAARAAAPESAWVRHAMLERIVRRGDGRELVRHLGELASDPSRPGRHLAAFQAAQIASDELADFALAEGLYEAAIDAAPEPRPILRELYAAAVRHGAVETAAAALARLVPQARDPRERSALLYELVTVTAAELGDLGRAAMTLKRALDVPEAAGWSSAVARVVAAATSDYEMLERAHGMLAEAADDPEQSAAHHAAAGRAALRAGRRDAAEEQLRRALDRQPGHPYALALLEEHLRQKGEADEVVSLLRDSALAAHGSRSAEMKLLLAGAAAEAADDVRLAAETYEQAADRDPTSVSPLWSLRRLAQERADRALLLRAREGLAERELVAGHPGRAVLELAEHYDLLSRKPELAEGPMRQALEDDSVGVAAAVGLLLLDGSTVAADARLAAIERLRGVAADGDRAELTRLLAAMAAEVDDELEARALEELERSHDVHPTTAIAALRLASRGAADDGKRGAALRTLALGAEDSATRAEIRFHAARARLVAGGERARAEAEVDARSVANDLPDSLLAAIALDEAIGPADDAELHARALLGRATGASAGHRAVIEAAAARALAETSRTSEAVEKLQKIVEAHPKDLASWDALRVAARRAGRYELVVKACDTLATGLDHEPRARLLEEAGLVELDHLGAEESGERRLAAALEVDPRLEGAYRRLHGRLTARNDNARLVALVDARARAIDDEAQLVRLHYELARLHRGLADRDAALVAIENVLLLDPGHAGAIAMSAEIHVSMGNFQKAVASLRGLAEADVPVAQKRVARLGAADFLEKKLGDPRGALKELEAVDALGLADQSLLERMARIAEEADLFPEAARILETASQRATKPAEVADYAVRAAHIAWRYLSDEGRAKTLFRRALDHRPDDERAAAGLVKLQGEGPATTALVDAFELAVRAGLDARHVDPAAVRKLYHSAGWRGTKDLQKLAISTLVALGIATPEEHEIDDENTAILRRVRPNPTVAETLVQRLRAPGDEGPVAELAAALSETFLELEALEPSKLGAGRGDSVGPKAGDPIRAELADITAAFGFAVHDHYAVAGDPNRVIGIPQRGGMTWVIGKGGRPPLDPVQRFHAGRQLAAAKAHLLPLLNHSPADAATRIYAACAAAESPLRGAEGRPGLPELTKALSRVISRRARKSVQELAPRVLTPERSVEAYCRAARRTTLRAGLLIAGDLHGALSVILGGHVSLEHLRASEDAMDLVGFHLSPISLALRRELGLAS